MTAREVLLDGGSPWGFRMNGGADVGHALRISRVNPGSKAAGKGVREGDVITSINGQPTRCLTNGESHALLRTVGDTLRLGLNQDTSGSPKRRSKEPLKREASSSSTQSQSSPSSAAPTPTATPTTAAPAASDTTATTPSDHSESTSAGTKVIVRGFWNSVSKTKQKTKNGPKGDSQQDTMENTNHQRTGETTTEKNPKASSSKARRLRKLKLKNGKREEAAEVSGTSTEVAGKENDERDGTLVPDAFNEIALEINVDVNENTKETEVALNKDSSVPKNLSGNADSSVTVEVLEVNQKTSKAKTKKKNGKGFSLSNIFTSKTDKGDHTREECKIEIEETLKYDQSSAHLANSDQFELPDHIVDDEIGSRSHDILPEVTISDCPVLNSSTTFTVIERELESRAVLPHNKTVTLSSSENEPPSTNSKKKTIKVTSPVGGYKQESEGDTGSISIFVVPAGNLAEETEAVEVDWESVSDFDSKSQMTTSEDDDVRPETLVHLPSNDLQTSAAISDGRNGIVQFDEYELSVQDLRSPILAPEEEATLRNFLKTLNLTKPEEFDDTSSTKSYGDSSSTMSESSPIPPASTDEIVVYKHLKTHSVAEACFIPPRHHRYLDVITEENSDPSDSEKKNGITNPWENSEIIRKNNELEEIPNDWYGSDEEPNTTSDEGGIDTSWRNGKKLEDVEGVEVVYLSDSEEDEGSLSNTIGERCNLVKNENLPELVVVHALDRANVKNIVKIKKPNEVNESNLKKLKMDEIMAILDSTYEINKDILTKQNLGTNDYMNTTKTNNNINNSISSTNGPITPKSELFERSLNFINKIDHLIKDSHSDTCNIMEENNSANYYSLTHANDKIFNDDGLASVPTAQEIMVAVTPPVLSRQGSSSSATSQSTARYNPGQSPMSSEAEDKTDHDVTSKKKKFKKIYNPKSLTNLSKDVVTCLPHGEFYLKKIGFWGNDVSDLGSGNIDPLQNGKLTSLPPSGISTRRSSFHELENIYSLHANSRNERLPSPPGPMLLASPPLTTLTSPPPNDEPWLGMPSADRQLIVCLSPSQSRDSTVTTPKQASDLLDLHKKFVQRRGYHERNPICSPMSDRSRTPVVNSPDLIRIEPYESNKERVYTPELLLEAANLLALKGYRQSRFRNDSQSKAVNVKENDNGSEKSGSLREVTSSGTKIAGDSEELDSNRSAGTSRLLALLQGSGNGNGDRTASPAPNNAVSTEMDRVDNVVLDKRSGGVPRYYGSYLTRWLTLEENVTSKYDFSQDVKSNDFTVTLDNINIFSNGQGDRRQFDAEKYKISKQGDIAIIQSSEDNDRQAMKGERPKSLPAVGVPALSPSGGESFREQMYHEYMNKVAERAERRQQKVIKISSRPNSMYSKTEPDTSTENPPQNPPVNKLESEFMVKVRERMSKLGINLDDGANNEGRPEGIQTEKQETLPKHLQEFIELTSAPQADDGQNTPSGVWSPGATPEPQRKEFNFSGAPEESAPEDTDPVSPIWTPKSAQASPTAERKTFRPVNFESPKLGRKTYNKPTEEVPKPPTDLPLTLNSSDHSHSHSQSSVSSTQYLTQTQTVTSSSTQSSSASRLVTSHSLPDTSQPVQPLPRAQNPTITLLQKAREGQLPKGAHYLDQNCSDSVDKRTSPPAVRPNEVLYSVRREYDSEIEEKRPKKIVDLQPKKIDGIGPVTKEGIPTVLRSEVQDENQQKWYKRMYDSLHRAERDKEYVTVRYKTRRGRYPYTSPGGYLSEPEPLAGYDSDYLTSKYATLDRRRIRNKDNDFTTSTMPRTKLNAVKHAVDVYKNQPGRIEDYEPGHSSISDKETKQWWDEVMDIFDGQFEQTQKISPRTHAPVTTSTSKPFMTYALKESGYESDSTLVFKRRDETQQLLSPAEQKLAYKTIQRGGDVPLHGLRKPVPEKPKESPHRYVESEVTIHYRSPVRSEEKEAWSEEELRGRQAEAMRRIYQEERRRKYLQELQDMYSRRHTDNFTPSQKSPIPLNRYDDFVDDLSPGKPRDRTPEPKLVARALYNFVGQSSRELTFRRGDIIYVRRQIDKNWYEGEHNAMIGLFPFNYVEIIPYDGIRTIPKRPTEGQARAKFNFQAQTHLELPLVKGELVLLTRRVDNNWYEGRIGTRKGIFPVSYVEVLVEPGERALSPVRVNTPTKPVASPAAHSLHMANNMSQHHHYQPPRPVSYTSLPRQKTADLKQPPVNQTLHIDTQNEPVPYRVLYNYKPQNEDELELVEGETVYVMEKCDDGWYVGSSQRTGYLGTFPGNYVERQV